MRDKCEMCWSYFVQRVWLRAQKSGGMGLVVGNKTSSSALTGLKIRGPSLCVGRPWREL